MTIAVTMGIKQQNNKKITIVFGSFPSSCPSKSATERDLKDMLSPSLSIYCLLSYRSTELAKMSGLSGISDIIGDMVAKGEINLEDAGLTPGEADQLVHRGIIR